MELEDSEDEESKDDEDEDDDADEEEEEEEELFDEEELGLLELAEEAEDTLEVDELPLQAQIDTRARRLSAKARGSSPLLCISPIVSSAAPTAW